MELFKFDQGLKDLFILIPITLVVCVTYILSQNSDIIELKQSLDEIISKKAKNIQ